ncbi:MAG TPA: lysophospholipid acyltransferase family protein [Enterovirga sp.]|jgi:1-acyl-sn-glycerol-3-phosphate acyltransferase
MSRFGIALRLAVQILVFLVLAPVEFVARRAGWAIADLIPVMFHRLFLWLFGIRVTVRGNPPEAGIPTLVLANHVSWLDIPVMASTVPVSFIAKSEVATWPIIGRLARLQRCIFLDRARKSATAEVNEIVAERLHQGEIILLFPEGTTGDGNRVLPFRSSLVGAARAALIGEGRELRDSIRLQPLAIAYTRREGLPVTRRERPQIAWYGDMDLLPHVAAFAREGPLDAVLWWGDPIAFEPGTDRKRVAAAAQDVIRRAVRSAIDA